MEEAPPTECKRWKKIIGIEDTIEELGTSDKENVNSKEFPT